MAEHWNRSWQGLTTEARHTLDLPQHQIAALTCPNCGGANLHHEAVMIATRKAEDQEGRIVTVDNGEFANKPGPPQVEHAEADSPRFAGRRGQVTIRFSCEGCEATPWLLLVQHKGTTFLGWCEPS